MAVPPFKGVLQTPADSFRQAKAGGQRLPDFAVSSNARAHYKNPADQEARDLTSSCHARLPSAQGGEDCAHQLRRPCTKERSQRAAKGDVVARDCGRVVCVSSAAEEAQQGSVIDRRELLGRQVCELCQLQSDQAGAQRLLQRLAHPQIGRQRERSHQLSQTEAASVPRRLPHVRELSRNSGRSTSGAAVAAFPATGLRHFHKQVPVREALKTGGSPIQVALKLRRRQVWKWGRFRGRHWKCRIRATGSREFIRNGHTSPGKCRDLTGCALSNTIVVTTFFLRGGR